jgi:tetratricopeptide (TPR) repeat protein
MKVLRYTLISCALAGALTYIFWADLAVVTAPARTAQASDTKLSRLANQRFWDIFHAGQYERADEALELLQAAWFENPRDPVLVSHMAWAHLWQLAERQRRATDSPRILDHAILSRQYFAEALALVPDEPRYTGFLSSVEMTVATITDNEALRRQGYFRGLKAIEQWPEFNGFTAAYSMLGMLPPDHEKFAEALEMVWQNNDACALYSADRKNVNLTAFLSIAPETMPPVWRRACINSWIAPYNLEGYLLVFGDALVKSGDWQLGVKLYRQLERTPDFKTWPYAHLVEARIRDAQANVSRFSQTASVRGQPPPSTGMMFNSSYTCMGCHQHSEASRAKHSPPDFVAKTL